MPYNGVESCSDFSKEGGAVCKAGRLNDNGLGSLAERFTQNFKESSESLIIVASFDNFGGLKRA
eukprot:6815266-Karenia_brevis.AAC.1